MAEAPQTAAAEAPPPAPPAVVAAPATAPLPVAPSAVPAAETAPSGGFGKIMSDFATSTKDLLRFVFIEERAERRKELVESLRFYVTYK